jgi:hypothetical protein
MRLAVAVTTANSQKQPTESLIYRIDNDGTLKVRGDGVATAAAAWGANNVGNRMERLPECVPGGANIIYGIKADGTLAWREHKGVRAGSEEWEDEDRGARLGRFQAGF